MNSLFLTFQHEMIHAYLFVTNDNRDHDDHGPQFHSHMSRINKSSGANITVCVYTAINCSLFSYNN